MKIVLFFAASLAALSVVSSYVIGVSGNRHRRQTYNPNYSSGGVATYPQNNYNQQPNYNPQYNQNLQNHNASHSIYPSLPTYPQNGLPNQPHYNQGGQPQTYPGQTGGVHQPQTYPTTNTGGAYQPHTYPSGGVHQPQTYPAQPGGIHQPQTYPGQIGGVHPPNYNQGGTHQGGIQQPQYGQQGANRPGTNNAASNDFYVSQTQGNRQPQGTSYPNQGTTLHGQTYPIRPGYQGGNYQGIKA